MNINDISVTDDGVVKPSEVMALRRAVDWDAATEQIWERCISQSLCVISARMRDSGELLGIGFLIGNARHGQIVDVAVHPRVQRLGIGRYIVHELVAAAWKQGVRYLGLSWDESKPWLRDFYAHEGFKSVGNVMWHANSLAIEPTLLVEPKS